MEGFDQNKGKMFSETCDMEISDDNNSETPPYPSSISDVSILNHPPTPASLSSAASSSPSVRDPNDEPPYPSFTSDVSMLNHPPTPASLSSAASSSPFVRDPNDEPPRQVGKPLDVGFTKNKQGKLVVGDVKVGKIGAQAIGTHGARIGFHFNKGGDHKVGNVTID
ncbi:hypothetical protein RND81_14G243200 [Saponaria officinalis]|uniref:Uncharacterized protein n=1 Tax=Saponaria officinalis TaxID=3572 RepID=A0AAW1GR80_SAPOF